MATIKKFEDLESWQLARQLAKEIFKMYIQSEPFLKDYKLKDQINSSSVSVMDNIAEGFERSGRNEFINFLSIANGSAGEVQSQLYRALDRKYIEKEKFDDLNDRPGQIGQRAVALISYLNKSEHKGNKFKDRTVL